MRGKWGVGRLWRWASLLIIGNKCAKIALNEQQTEICMNDFENNLLTALTPKKEPVKPGPKKAAKKPDVIIPKKVCQAGKNKKDEKRAIPSKDREKIRSQLVQFYGTTWVENELMGLKDKVDLSNRLIRLRNEMEIEIERLDDEQRKYFDAIEKDYQLVGRPNVSFGRKELDFLCALGCTSDEIAGFFDICVETLRKKVKAEFNVTLSRYMERRSQGVKIALRRAQIKNAIAGDTSMQKFLGINMLGQKNKVEFDGQVQINTFADMVKSIDNKTNGVNNENSKDEPTDE